jgi:hypothetical protein
MQDHSLDALCPVAPFAICDAPITDKSLTWDVTTQTFHQGRMNVRNRQDATEKQEEFPSNKAVIETVTVS